MTPNDKQIKVIDSLIHKLEMLKYNDVHSIMIESKLRKKLETELLEDIDNIPIRDVKNISNIFGKTIRTLKNI